VEAQEGGLGVVGVGLGAAHDVGEGQLAVLLHRGEAKVLAAEEEQRVEQHDGGVRAQLLAVPQEALLHSGVDVTWREGEREREGGGRERERERGRVETDRKTN